MKFLVILTFAILAFVGQAAAIFLLPLPSQPSCGCPPPPAPAPPSTKPSPSSPPGDDEVIYVDDPEDGRKLGNVSVRGPKGIKIIRRRRRRVG